MKHLASLREQINKLDDKLIEVLNQRSDLVAKIALLKCQARLPLYDAEREADILAHIIDNSSSGYRKEDLVAIFYSIFRAGLNQQLLYRADYKE